MGKPIVRLKVTRKKNGKIEVVVQEKSIPAPVITFVGVNDDQNQATAYGFAVHKNMNARIKIDMFIDGDCYGPEIFGICIGGYRSEYEFREYDDTLDHTGLKFMEDRHWLRRDQEFGWIWNDSQSGKFEYTFNLDDESNKDINIGDKIYTKSHVWGDTKFNVMDNDYTVNIFTSDSNGLESEDSNIVEIKRWILFSDFADRALFHSNNKIKCSFGGETVETGVDCRGLALLSIRELTNKSAGGTGCNRFGDCNPRNDIPSTGVDGIAKNYFPYLGILRKDFSYTVEAEPQKGGLTIYD